VKGFTAGKDKGHEDLLQKKMNHGSHAIASGEPGQKEEAENSDHLNQNLSRKRKEPVIDRQKKAQDDLK
jgi:hypothetical protein